LPTDDREAVGSARVVVRDNVVVRVYVVETGASLLRLPKVTRGKPFVVTGFDLPERLQVDHVVHGSGSGVQEGIDENVTAAVVVELELGKGGVSVPTEEAEDPDTVPC
jgi:hypothetical protein